MNNRFDGQRVLVTGAAGGIGGAIARRFAQERAWVLVTDREHAGLEKLAQELGATAIEGDVSTAEGCKSIIAEALNDRPLNVLCNNAGINRRGDILAISEDDWDSSFAVNIEAVFHLCRAVTMFFGLKIHKAPISIAVAQGKRRGEVRHWSAIARRHEHIRKLVEKLAAGGAWLHFCHEAGPCGYGLYRQLVEMGHD